LLRHDMPVDAAHFRSLFAVFGDMTNCR
jgi:hypothetical protein